MISIRYWGTMLVVGNLLLQRCMQVGCLHTVEADILWGKQGGACAGRCMPELQVMYTLLVWLTVLCISCPEEL